MSHTNLELKNLLAGVDVIPVLTIHQLAHAVPLAKALAAGGLNVIELTLRTPVALAAVEMIRQQVPELVVGVGTVNHPGLFKASYDAGAAFAVSPGVTDALLSAAENIPLPFLPGVATPGEAMRLFDAGYRYLKLFPAEAVGGCALLKSMSGPLPEIMFCPTGGINVQKARDYLQLPNVVCVGGSWLTPADALSQENWPAIKALAQESVNLRVAT